MDLKRIFQKQMYPTSDDMLYRVAEKVKWNTGVETWEEVSRGIHAENEAVKIALERCSETGRQCVVYPEGTNLVEAEQTKPQRVLFITYEQLGGEA